jgi:hypothetical protein
MVNHINMDENKLKNIISDYKNRGNNELKFALSELSKDFEETKALMVKLSHHLDGTEKIYNDILKEYKKRGN